jgi:putative transposase
MKQFGFGGTDLARCLQKFAAVHSSVHNHFNQERHFYSRFNFKLNRAAALTECANY